MIYHFCLLKENLGLMKTTEGSEYVYNRDYKVLFVDQESIGIITHAMEVE